MQIRLLALLFSGALAALCNDFLVQPYLQLGDAPALSSKERITLMWHTPDSDQNWSVSFRSPAGRGKWLTSAPASFQRIRVRTVEPHRVYRATLEKLAPGQRFEYRVSSAGKELFASEGVARKSRKQPARAVVFGDCGADTAGQREIAYQTQLARPDMVFITGDIVYSRGRVSEYRTKYFPIYNAPAASPASGAPLIRSIPFLSSPGNHDILTSDFTAYPDTLAYFYYWAQPLNGPELIPGGPNTLPMRGDEADLKAFRTSAGAQYPGMSNFSFDYGSAHWTVLDANPYVDWRDRSLQEWLRKDLAAAKHASWRFVAFHQPGFNSSKAHFDEQQMRWIAPILEEEGVDVVFTGHVHNYQRSYPMTFRPDPKPVEGKPRWVSGSWTLDKNYNGSTNTRPKGVIYLVTGGGGAGLYDRGQQEQPGSWQEFTSKFVSQVHSFTVVDITAKALEVKQVSAAGAELDRFRITR